MNLPDGFFEGIWRQDPLSGTGFTVGQTEKGEWTVS